jgi:riboflavin synthase
MFTGIVTAIGTIAAREERGDLHLRIACPWDPAAIAVGASIACAGVCLTVVERGGTAGDAWFAVDVSAETLSRTAAGSWEQGARLNLEPSLRVGDELGGHIVSGHVDAVGTIVSRAAEGDSIRLTVEAPPELAPFLAEKGSVAVDGVSLTVNSVEDQPGGSVRFGLNLIPHTADVTTLGALAEGNEVNLEIDTVARYLRRLESLRG